jgi:hypothetical protein
VKHSEACALSDDELAAAVREANARFLATLTPAQIADWKTGIYPPVPKLPIPGTRSHCETLSTTQPDAFEGYYG